MRQNRPILVFSHLRWDFVYQRPQHLLSRMAATWPVIFVEEPVYDPNPEPYWEVKNPAPCVKVYRPHTNVSSWGFNDEQLPALRSLLRKLTREEQLEHPAVWLYTPMALPLAKMIEPSAVIYDCMDELSAFLFAPQELVEREAELMKTADVVFTGGPSLYKAKLGRNANLHCFPSSVDAAHFRQALITQEAPEQANLPYPRLGFFGVIDERMDLGLLNTLATAHPEWQIVMVGPVVKIDWAHLPQHPNIHYLGQRSYSELPSFLAGWDVCLLPFARNESTRFISPTKTLEYMAAERSIVSTPITDVAVPYGDIVYLGDTPEAFIAACERALSASEEEKAARVAKMRNVLARTSWDSTAAAMQALIAQVLHNRAEKLDMGEAAHTPQATATSATPV